ncbi:YfgM family protein [Ramlibacter sp. MAHUQ-53]|uniref:YfgM family protein n=1 Tax=unclassified Ramlibacter TaxID=2617605 RepID=UPI00362E8E00
MASHLDLEEQEQLAEIKHFWNKYGNLITWVLIVAFGAVAAWNGWHWWQNRQAAQASALFAEVDRAAQSGEMARVERAFADIKDKFGGTTYAAQAGLLAGRALAEGGKGDAAKAALGWVAEKSSDDGLKAVARLRLAGLLADAKAYDDALRQLDAGLPAAFAALAADRRGDILQLQGKKDAAKAEYKKALAGLDARNDYRRLVEVKLTALGGEAVTAAAPAAPAK